MPKKLEQLNFALQFLQQHANQAKQNVTNIDSIFKVFKFKTQLLTLHSICVQFAINLGDQYKQLAIPVDEGDEFQSQLQNQLANYMLTISKEAEFRIHNIYEEAIEPVMHFEENFNTNNSAAIQKIVELLEKLAEQRKILKQLKQK